MKNPPSKGCKIDDWTGISKYGVVKYGDFTCLNTVIAEVPKSQAEWIRDQGALSHVYRKMVRKIQTVIAKYVQQRRSVLYPKSYHPLTEE